MLIKNFLLSIIIFMLQSCIGVGTSSFEFNSAKTYARIDKDFKQAEEWGLKAMEAEPNNALIPYFLAREVYKPMKKKNKVIEMYVEALSRNENLKLDNPFKVGGEYINNVHDAIKHEAFMYYNEGVKLYQKEKKSKAAVQFEISQKLNPEILGNYTALSDIAYENGDIDKAIKYLDMGTELNNNNDFAIRKATYAKDQKQYDIALTTLQKIITDDEQLKMTIERDIFLIYLDQENYMKAIETGNALIEKMYSSLEVDDLVLSETCYNVAISNRHIGYELYNEILETINSATEDKEIISMAIDKCEKSINYLETAKDRFYDASSFNPDDLKSSGYAKDINKFLDQINDLFLPSLTKSMEK